MRGAFHQLKLLNGLSSAGAALNGIIVAFDRDEKCTFAKRSHAQVIFCSRRTKTCENLQRSTTDAHDSRWGYVHTKAKRKTTLRVKF